MSDKRVWIWKRAENETLQSGLQAMATYLGLPGRIRRGDRVALKPNLTYTFHKPGVTTSPKMIEAVVELLKSFTDDIVIVESSGGANAWQAEEAFEKHNVFEICRKYGVRAINLTQSPRRMAETEIAGKSIQLELSRLLLDETDYFITLPVPKVHVMTRVSLGFKNQWGCIPDVKRCRHHPEFRWKILAIHKLLQTKLAIFDGEYFLNRTGPMEGDPVKMDLVVAGDVGCSTRVCCEIMGVDPMTVSHLALAIQEGMMPKDMSEINTNIEDLGSLKMQTFYLKRTPINYVTLGAFKSRIMTRMIYDSPLAKPVHDVLYLVRGRPKDLAPKW